MNDHKLTKLELQGLMDLVSSRINYLEVNYPTNSTKKKEDLRTLLAKLINLANQMPPQREAN